jgi:hypothetical protein
MKKKDQILLEEAYQNVYENFLSKLNPFAKQQPQQPQEPTARPIDFTNQETNEKISFDRKDLKEIKNSGSVNYGKGESTFSYFIGQNKNGFYSLKIEDYRDYPNSGRISTIIGGPFKTEQDAINTVNTIYAQDSKKFGNRAAK